MQEKCSLKFCELAGQTPDTYSKVEPTWCALVELFDVAVVADLICNFVQRSYSWDKNRKGTDIEISDDGRIATKTTFGADQHGHQRIFCDSFCSISVE